MIMDAGSDSASASSATRVVRLLNNRGSEGACVVSVNRNRKDSQSYANIFWIAAAADKGSVGTFGESSA
jgi:hypothetical protein